MSRRRGSREEPQAGGIPAVYEGPEVLTALLARAGSPHDAEEVARRFERAQRAGEDRAAVIPGLFPEEPRFEGPDAARRLYGNLFGLWARIATGLGVADDAPALPEAQPSPPPPLPRRGSVPGAELTPELVEAVWKNLAAEPPRAIARRRDRFQNGQPDLAAWLDAVPLPESGAVAATDLVFETWVMFDHAFGERLRAVEFRDVRALEAEPPPMGEEQPALAAYVAEQLDLAADEDPAFGPPERAQVEHALATAAAALTRAVQIPS